MANFQQHLSFAAMGCGIAVSPLLGANLLSLEECCILWAAGVLGGILPDIDSDNSSALKILFALISVVIAGALLHKISRLLTTVEIWLLILLVYGVVFEGARRFFAKFTVHRGIFHSLIAGCVMALVVVISSNYLLRFSAKLSWLTGTFCLIGYLLHLLLDEIYSVDFMNSEIKRSFGSAFKLTDFRNWYTTSIMVVSLLGLSFFTPPHKPAWELLSSEYSIARIRHSFTPTQWLSVDRLKRLIAASTR